MRGSIILKIKIKQLATNKSCTVKPLELKFRGNGVFFNYGGYEGRRFRHVEVQMNEIGNIGLQKVQVE